MSEIPYAVYEGMQIRHERTTKLLIIALIIAIIAGFASNALWLYAWSQYDYTSEDSYSETVNVDGKEGVANYIGNDGDIVNGENNSNENKKKNKDTPQEKR